MGRKKKSRWQKIRWSSDYKYKKYSGIFFGYSLLVVFVLSPLVGWIDYLISLWTGGMTVTVWDSYTFFFMGCLVLGGFGGIISYVFHKLSGKAAAYFSWGVIVVSLFCGLTDFFFWILRGIHRQIPLSEWFPVDFPAIQPWRSLGISMTTELHLMLVAVGFVVIFGGTYLFTKKYL